MSNLNLMEYDTLLVKQKREVAELFGIETRNKYEILNAQGTPVAYAAEQARGILGAISKQLLGHWKRFNILVFSTDRQEVMNIKHPFRLFFQRLEVYSNNGIALGFIQQHFSLIHKSFSIEDSNGTVLMTVRSPFWKLWTFPFQKDSEQVAVISKRWSGILSEMLTDKDSFCIKYHNESLPNEERMLLLAASLFIDLNYFERKAGR